MFHFIFILILGAWGNPVMEGPLTFPSDAKKIIHKAESLIGTPYRYGGNKPSGFDCSGFTQYVFYKERGIRLPHNSLSQYTKGKKIKLKKCEAGDLVFFRHGRNIGHVGIIQKTNRKGIWMIHASTSKGVISEEITGSTYWRSKIAGVRRIP